MGLFTKPEVTILKESSKAKEYLEKLENLLPKVQGEVRKQVEKEIAITKAGIQGEENILFELKNSAMDMVVLRDLYIETRDGAGAQIDFIVITRKVNFIIECKNLFGNISINSKGDFIRTMEYGGKKHSEGIYSPITQNERHMAVLRECKMEDKNFVMRAMMQGTFDDFNKSLVVLANPKTIINDKYVRKEIKQKVIRADQLITVMKEMNAKSKQLSSSKKDMLKIAENLLERNHDERIDYFEKFENVSKQVDEEIEKRQEPSKMICPRCGAKLVLRTAKKGPNVGQEFYGCSTFPKCRFVLNVSKN